MSVAKDKSKIYTQADVYRNYVSEKVEPPTQTRVGDNTYVMTFYTGARSYHAKFQCRGVSYNATVGNADEMSLKEALRLVSVAKQRVKAGGVTPGQFKKMFGAMTVREFYEQHYRPHCQKTKKSHRNIDNIFQKRILPAFGDVPLKDVPRKAVRGYITNLHGAIDG
mgnify:CR=1 FL=1